MKLNRKKVWLLSSVLTVALLLGACTQDVQKYTEEEETALLTELITEDIASTNSKEFKMKMDAELKKLSINASSDLIDAWLYTLYAEVSQMNNQLTSFEAELVSLTKKELNVLKKTEIVKIEDKVLKALLEEIHSNEFVNFDKTEDFFHVEPNFVKIKEEYGEYMRKDMLAYIDLSIEEMEKDFYDAKKNTFDLEVIAKRILTLESMLEKFPDSVYFESFQQTQVYYYQLYFGSNSAVLMNADGTSYLESVVNVYKVHAKDFKETTFGKDIQKVVTVLDASNNSISSDLTQVINDILIERSPEQWAESTESQIENPSGKESSNSEE